MHIVVNSCWLLWVSVDYCVSVGYCEIEWISESFKRRRERGCTDSCELMLIIVSWCCLLWVSFDYYEIVMIIVSSYWSSWVLVDHCEMVLIIVRWYWSLWDGINYCEMVLIIVSSCRLLWVSFDYCVSVDCCEIVWISESFKRRGERGCVYCCELVLIIVG